MKQHEAVAIALDNLGGYATLSQLYQAVMKIPSCEWKTKTPFASIRRIVQTHDKFFRIRPGLWGLSARKSEITELFPEAGEHKSEKQVRYEHGYYQGLLLELGRFKHFGTYAPAQDKNRAYLGGVLRDHITITELPEFTYDHVLQRGRNIDVVWFNERGYPNSFFEVEFSTDFKNSLVKYVEFQDFQVNMYLVADESKKREYDFITKSAAFAPIFNRVKFLDFSSVSLWHEKSAELSLVQGSIYSQ